MTTVTEVFDTFDVAVRRALPKTDAAAALRCTGRLLLPQQVDALLADAPDPVPRDFFLQLAAAPLPETAGAEAREEEVEQALRAFDTKEAGTLSRFDTQQAFCAMDNKVPAAEFDRLIGSRADLFAGKDEPVQIAALAAALTAAAEKMRPPMGPFP